MTKPASLRSTLTLVTAAVTLLALMVAGALITLTTALHETTSRSSFALESVRLAEEAAMDLLLHERSAEPLLQRAIEGDLVRRLRSAQRFVTTEEESRALADAVTRVNDYVSGTRDPVLSAEEVASRHQIAYGAIETLVTVSTTQSRVAQQDAARWDRLGNVLGMTVGALLIVFAGGFLFWLRGRAFESILGLADAMQRFGNGDREARAAERGPREVREMCRHFNEMASSIAEQRAAQTAFLGGVAHDLRNPLSALEMSVALLGAGQEMPPEARYRQTIDRLKHQIRRMERMLGDFLDVARIEAGHFELRVEIHDVRTTVREVVELFEATSPAHTLTVRLPENAVMLRCDPLRIDQVLTNLISNAIKYSPPRSPVAIALEARGDEVELSVSDRGVGIPEREHQHIFEPFRRTGLSKESVPGVGLGLFVVRRIVEAHQGRIDVTSTAGKGSTFRIVLPLEPKASEPAPSR